MYKILPQEMFSCKLSFYKITYNILKVNYQLNEIKELTMPTFCFNIHTISAIIDLNWSRYTHYEVVLGISGGIGF